MNSEPRSGNPNHEAAEKEASYFNPLTIGFAAIGLVVMIALVLGVAALLSRVGPPRASGQATPITPPAPRLQVAPPAEFQELKATQMERLATYDWVNPDAGVVRIPIDRAMQIMVARGYVYTPGTPAPAGTPAPSPEGDLAAEGQNVFQELGCGSCHTGAEGAVGPPLEGIFGHQVTLQSGQTVTVDEDYIRESILNPSAQLVEGYQDFMPSFQGRINEQQLNALVAYIRLLGGE